MSALEVEQQVQNFVVFVDQDRMQGERVPDQVTAVWLLAQMVASVGRSREPGQLLPSESLRANSRWGGMF